jgi:hypothetical protein
MRLQRSSFSGSIRTATSLDIPRLCRDTGPPSLAGSLFLGFCSPNRRESPDEGFGLFAIRVNAAARFRGAGVPRLKEQLAAAEARINKQADDLIAYDTAYAAGLAAERAKVEAERAKAERVIADFAARDAQQAADLAAERARTEKAIAAFSALADRLDQLAAERARPWWRRLAG